VPLTIGDNAFAGVETLATIVLPARASVMGATVFADCTALSIYIKEKTEMPATDWDTNWAQGHMPYWHGHWEYLPDGITPVPSQA